MRVLSASPERKVCTRSNYAKIEEDKAVVPGKSTDGWLGITDKYWALAVVPSGKQPFQPRFSYLEDGRTAYQSDFLTDTITIAPGASADRDAGLRRRQGSERRRRLRDLAPDPPVRPADRLGLVLFHHQADVPPHRLVLQALGQFRPGDPRHHRRRQAHILPPCQQILRVDGEHEEGAAEADGTARNTRTTR